MKNILLIITLFISWNAIAEEKVWYCKAEESMGMSYKSGAWESGIYELKRMTVKAIDDKLIFPESFGFDYLKVCTATSDIVSCSAFAKTFMLNTSTGKATSSVLFGWIASPEYKTDDMSVTAWKCESF